jgi:hypothetical protein
VAKRKEKEILWAGAAVLLGFVPQSGILRSSLARTPKFLAAIRLQYFTKSSAAI